jgi:hypothetical protein
MFGNRHGIAKIGPDFSRPLRGLSRLPLASPLLKQRATMSRPAKRDWRVVRLTFLTQVSFSGVTALGSHEWEGQPERATGAYSKAA